MVKFGKDLESNMLKKWAAHYIDYEALKSILKKGATVEVKREFREAYEAQLKEVSAFFVAQLSALESAAASRKDTLTKMTSLDQVQASSKHYQVFRDLTDLRSFAWINAEGFRKISKKYGVLSKGGKSYYPAGVSMRGTFVIDQKGIVRHQVINDEPLGRNMDEVVRIVEALQFFEEHGQVCPAGWNKGDDGMTNTPEGVASYLSENADNL